MEYIHILTCKAMTTDEIWVRILIYNDCGTEKFLNVFFPVYMVNCFGEGSVNQSNHNNELFVITTGNHPKRIRNCCVNDIEFCAMGFGPFFLKKKRPSHFSYDQTAHANFVI